MGKTGYVVSVRSGISETDRCYSDRRSFLSSSTSNHRVLLPQLSPSSQPHPVVSSLQYNCDTAISTRTVLDKTKELTCVEFQFQIRLYISQVLDRLVRWNKVFSQVRDEPRPTYTLTIRLLAFWRTNKLRHDGQDHK
jgi:hypothetical protein